MAAVSKKMGSPTRRSGTMALTMDDRKILGNYTKRLEKSLPPQKFQTRMFKTHNSNWTPMVHKASNEQIFKERREMVSNWFDMWSDSQRKRFLDVLFRQCKKSQLRFIQDWFNERVPLRHLDFTRTLPQFLSLYVFSFLDPRSLCRASMVCWHWRFLTEQDVLWMPKCVRYGWYLPYTPDLKEYGAWKGHYVACLKSLDMDVPSKNAILDVSPQSAVYGTIGDGSNHLTKPRRKSAKLDPRASMEIIERRRPWQPPDHNPQDLRRSCQALLHDYDPNNPMTDPSQTLHHTKYGTPKANLSTFAAAYYDYGLQSQERKAKHRSLEGNENGLRAGTFTSLNNALELVNLEERRLTDLTAKPWEPIPDPPERTVFAKRSNMSESDVGHSVRQCYPSQPHPRVIFISSRVPAADLLVDAVLFGVIPIVYEYEGTTLESLLSRLQSCLQGRSAQSIGVFAHSDVHWELRIVHGATVTLDNLDESKFVEFWESISTSVLPSSQGGHIDLFVPLASCEAGMEMMLQLNVLSGVTFTSPTGVVGVYNHINSEWLKNPEDVSPPGLYFCTSKLNVWANTADQVCEACTVTKNIIGRYFERKHRDVVSQLTGQIVFDAMGQVDIQGVQGLTDALVDGLISLAKQQNVKPFEYLGNFLLNHGGTKSGDYVQNTLMKQQPGDTLAPAPTMTANSLSEQLCLTERFDDSLPNSEFSHLSEEANTEVANINGSKSKHQKEEANQGEKQDEEKEVEEEIEEDIMDEENLTPRQHDSDPEETDVVDSFIPQRKTVHIERSQDGDLQEAQTSLQTMYRNVLSTKDSPSPSSNVASQWSRQPRRLTAQQLADHPEKRTPIAREILSSEVDYMRTLEMIRKYFYSPLRAALASNRAIISSHNLQDIFSDVLGLLDISRGLEADLRDRLADWGPQECLGDIFVKFCTKLKAYVNYLNNYPVILITIERCMEQTPIFRSFLKRHERQPETKMLSLPELLLAPTRRIGEYVTMVTWFTTHTPNDHADCKDLASALESLQNLHKLIQDTRLRGQRERELVALQKSILHCPVLLEANRYFLQQQDVAHLKPPKPNTVIPELRVYQHIEMLGLYLFNDSLVVTRRTSRHTPFERAVEQNYRFETCASLTRLRVEEIPDSKYVKNAFRLYTPHREWICSTETYDQKLNFFTRLENTIHTCLHGE